MGMTVVDSSIWIRHIQRHNPVLDVYTRKRLMGRGIGFIDAHLLYSTVSRPGTRLWTLDKRLAALAARFGVEHPRLH